eukprot:NODE_288_length_11703_cov_0.386591.p2 type:complete len:351 gc:universal NODE_288_length_11703_cov_0.386591:1982-930(-)
MIFYLIILSQTSAQNKWLSDALYFNGNDSSWYQSANMSNTQDVLWAVRNYTAYNDVLWACRDITDSATAAACLAFTNTSNVAIASGTNYPGVVYNNSTSQNESANTHASSENFQGGYFTNKGNLGNSIGQGMSGQTFNQTSVLGTEIGLCSPDGNTLTVAGLLQQTNDVVILLFAVVNATSESDFYLIFNQAMNGDGFYGNSTIYDPSLASTISKLTNNQPLIGVANVTFDKNPCYMPPKELIQAASGNATVAQVNGNFSAVTNTFESLSGNSTYNWTNAASYIYNGTIGNYTSGNFTMPFNASIPIIGRVGKGVSCGPLQGNPICGEDLCCSRTEYVCVEKLGLKDCLY